MAKTEKSIPFVLEDTHHRGVEGRSIARAEGHNGEGILFVIGPEEGEFWLVLEADEDLMVAGFVVQADEIKAPSGVAKIINGIITARNRVFEREGDLVETPIRNTHAPDEIGYVGNVFLVRLSSKDDRRAPWPFTDTDPAVMEKDFEMFHDDFALVGSVVRFSTTNGGGAAGVNTKFKVENREANAG